MKIREFYDKMKNLVVDKIIIMRGVSTLYEGYIEENRIYEFLMDEEIIEIYWGGTGLVLEIKSK